MLRWLKRIALLLVALVAICLFAAWMLLRGSLPKLDGQSALTGLSAAVTVQRDRLGVVTIDANNEADAMRALGYVHAQERFFGMDLMRRSAAGELAALFGPVALEYDKARRVHRMRARTVAQLSTISGDRMAALQAYTEGVNAGLAALKARPWPYLLLRQSPRPWRVEDSALAGYAMYFDLQDEGGERELGLWKLRQHLPPALYALLAHGGTRWDAPLSGDAIGEAVLPGADEVDLRSLPAPDEGAAESPASSARAASLTPPAASRMAPLSPAVRDRGVGEPPAAADLYRGSNNFAVDGTLTRDGRAIVADDMHLGLRAPGIWFRARLRYPDLRAPGGKIDVQGLTLPGLPAMIVGSNGHVAWAFTNSYVDTTDWKRVHPCADGRDAPACAPVTRHRETIEVAGAGAATLVVEDTTWGPILEREPDGSALALRWTAHLPGGLNLGLAEFARAGNLATALRAADHAALPTQNLLLADSQGRIAWRLLGPLPQRTGSCSTQRLVEGDTGTGAHGEQDAAGECRPWTISTAASPQDIDPVDHRLWTANARVVGDGDLARIGDGGYALGARAAQIRDALQARDRFDERDLLAIQLDDRALFLQRWWQLLRDEAGRTHSPALSALADAAKERPERASADSVGYRLVRGWRLAVIARLQDGLAAPARAGLGEAFTMPQLAQFEGVAWPLLQQRPAHLLPRRFDSWDALLEDAAAQVQGDLSAAGPLAARTWGERNTAHICHPLAAAIPLVGERLLCMPPDPLDGDGNMPRVTAPDFGASERMVVSPGHEADGILHMPGGQSGHPLSPFWGAGHEDWVHGRPTPFLPGESEHTLTLRPR
ncbi:penicillin acylase family protein [Luteimonas lutimaris]|uniref:Penicillin acylase family protein n=1 Tax=Luteimonas lutimaris TaxID=698645 RepID=A0ABP7MGJ2_9GAMM